MLAWTGLGSVVLFLLANIETIETGVGYAFLLVTVVAAAAIVATIGNPLRSIGFPRSTLFLLMFLTYFLLRLFFDMPYLADVKAITVGTSGGIGFAILLGLAVALFISTIFSAQGLGLRSTLPGYLFLGFALYFVADALITHLGSLRADLFLIDSEDRQYQRPGNFIVILTLIFSMLLSSVRIFHERYRNRQLVLKAVIIASYVGINGMLLVMAQLIGSNAGFFVGFLVSGATLLWIWRPGNRSLRWSRHILSHSIGSGAVFQRSVPSFLGKGIVLGFVVLLGVAVLLSYTNFELQQFRIFGFGEGRIGGNSIASRVRILSTDFLTQFAHNPLFGHLRADELTTGGGSYAHSLVSLFSHVGVVGAFLFVAYLVAVYRDIGRCGGLFGSFYGDTDVGVLRIILLTVLCVFGLVATFFTWMPLWFVLGLVCPPIRLESHLLVQEK